MKVAIPTILVFVFTTINVFAGPSISGGGLDMPYSKLQCGNILQARFYENLQVPAQGAYQQYIYLAYTNAPEAQFLMNVSSASNGNIKFTILDRHPYCETSLADVGMQQWTLFRTCEGQIQKTDCQKIP